MYQAHVQQWGQAPKYIEVADDTLPAPSADQVRVKVEAVGIHRVVLSRAAGKHYSTARTNPPHVPGVDGVGTLEDGTRVYWMSFDVGGLSEHVNVPRSAVRVLPAGADPVQIAAMVNPAMSSWMALTSRTNDVPAGFTVLILGATSASGQVAITLAKKKGAGRVIGVARDAAALEALKSHGLDETIVMDSDDPTKTDFSTLGDVDVVLDYVYGPLMLHLLNSLQSSRPVQYVEIGSLSGPDISLPSSILRSKNITIRGSGPGAWSIKMLAEQMEGLLEAACSIPPQQVRVAKLAEVEKVWNETSKERLVITM